MAKQLQEYAKKNDLKIIGAGDYKLTLKGIHHVYGNKADDETEAIKHIDLNVRDGEFLAIVGEVAVGKVHF